MELLTQAEWLQLADLADGDRGHELAKKCRNNAAVIERDSRPVTAEMIGQDVRDRVRRARRRRG